MSLNEQQTPALERNTRDKLLGE